MSQSEKVNELFEALSLAQAELENPPKNKEANVRSYKYKYADMADVLNGCRPVLAKHGLTVMQITHVEGNALALETRIGHKSGQWISSTYPVCSINSEHQSMGSAMTYARRYALTSMIGVAAEDDTDGVDAGTIQRGDMQKPTQAPTEAARLSQKDAKERQLGEQVEALLDSANSMEELQAKWAEAQPIMKRCPKTWMNAFSEWKERKKFELQNPGILMEAAE